MVSWSAKKNQQGQCPWSRTVLCNGQGVKQAWQKVITNEQGTLIKLNAQKQCTLGRSRDGLPRRNKEMQAQNEETPSLAAAESSEGFEGQQWYNFSGSKRKAKQRKQEPIAQWGRRSNNEGWGENMKYLMLFFVFPFFFLFLFTGKVSLCFLSSQSLLVYWNEALCPGEDRPKEHRPTGYTEVHRTRQVASEVAGGAVLCHWEDTVYHLGKVMDQVRFPFAGGK